MPELWTGVLVWCGKYEGTGIEVPRAWGRGAKLRRGLGQPQSPQKFNWLTEWSSRLNRDVRHQDQLQTATAKNKTACETNTETKNAISSLESGLQTKTMLSTQDQIPDV